jgi:hypothetical protein
MRVADGGVGASPPSQGFHPCTPSLICCVCYLNWYDFPIDSTLYLLLSVHCLNGVIAAIVAQSKGRNLSKWLVLGLIGGTVALVAAIALKPVTKVED